MSIYFVDRHLDYVVIDALTNKAAKNTRVQFCDTFRCYILKKGITISSIDNTTKFKETAKVSPKWLHHIRLPSSRYKYWSSPQVPTALTIYPSVI